jgi:hypothetical protein
MPGVDQQLMNTDQLRQWILRRLGAPIHKVELCEEHITDAVEQARRWFSAKKGVIKPYFVNINSSVVEYDLDVIDRDIDVVTDVSFMQGKLDLSLIFSPFTLLEEKIPYDVFASGGSGGLYSSYIQSLQYIKTAKRILSADMEWRQADRILHITPIPDQARSMIVEAKTHCIKIEDLTERDHDLVKRYALAKAREDLMWILGKFGEFPGAQGTTSLNYAILQEQIREEIEKLEEEITGSAGPMGFLTG